MTKLAISDVAINALDLDNFTCIDGTEEQRAFCTLMTDALSKHQKKITAEDFICVCERLDSMVNLGLRIDPELYPEVYRSRLYEFIISINNFSLESDFIVNMAQFCFNIEIDHPFIVELKSELGNKSRK